MVMVSFPKPLPSSFILISCSGNCLPDILGQIEDLPGQRPADFGLGSTGPFTGRKRSLREGGVRVPGIVEWPGRLSPAVVDAPAGTTDTLPTVLSAAGLPLPDVPLDGVDLMPLLRGEVTARSAGMGFRHRGAEAWHRGRWKIRREGDAPFTLHDVEADPAESRDLARERPGLVEQLSAELRAWRETL